MNIGFVADVHLANFRAHGGRVEAGLNQRCRHVLDVLTRAKEQAKELGCETLVVLGDLFDTHRPEPQVIAAAQEALSGIDCLVLVGNHDQVSTAAGDHALGPLNNYGSIVVIEQPRIVSLGETELWCVPFQPGEASVWLPESLQGLAKLNRPNKARRVLCLHLGLIDKDTPPWLRASPGALPVEAVDDLCAKHGLGFVAAGDWHKRKQWGNTMQVGTLCPAGWDDPGLDGYGTLAVLDGPKLRFEELPGPRFVNLKPGDALPKVPQGTQLYVRVKADPERVEECRAHVASLVDQGYVVGGEVVADEAEVEVATRAAARAATSRETLNESLTAWVTDMPLDDGVDRSRVLSRCQEFLK